MGLFTRKRREAEDTASAMAQSTAITIESPKEQNEQKQEEIEKRPILKEKFIMETPALRPQIMKEELPIYDIYRRFQEDWETKGFSDARQFPETAYKESQKRVLVDKLRLAIKEALLKYDDKIIELDSCIDEASKNGLIETLKKYEQSKRKLSSHFDELSILDKDAQEIGEKTKAILISYDMGFARGQASLSNDKVNEIMGNK